MERVVAATAAVFGLVVSGGLVAVAVAGFLQWGPAYPDWLDDGLPLLVLALAMLLAGRVAVDVAGPVGGLVGTVGAGVLVGVVGFTVSRSSEAHGDGIELSQVLLATLVVLVLTSASALVVGRRRGRSTAEAPSSR